MTVSLFDAPAQGSSSGGGGSGAPTNSQYVTLALDSSLTAERVLTAGTGITVTDAGANSTVTIASTIPAPLTTKGDVYTYSTAAARLAVGTNGQVLSADSTQATGLKWVANSASLAIGGAITGGTATRLLYEDTGVVLADDAGMTWDKTNKFVQLTGTPGKQLRLAYDGSHYFDVQSGNTSGAFGTVVSMIPSGTQDGSYALWKMYGSDFCFSYNGSAFLGTGVPAVCISGPPNTGTYTSASGPGLSLNNELAAADNRLWSQYLNNQTLTFQCVKDDNTAAGNWLTVTRSGTTPTGIETGCDLGVSVNLILRSSANARASYLYTDSAGQLILLPNTGSGEINLNGLIVTTKFKNASPLQWKDNGGTARTVLQMYSDNHIYFDNSASGNIYLRTGATATRYQIDSDGKMAWNGAATVAQQTVGANVNNVGASGTTGQFDDFTNGTVYATDYANLHATIYQLTRSVAQLTVAMRNYGLGG